MVTKTRRGLLLSLASVLLCTCSLLPTGHTCWAQTTTDSNLEKMPSDLEMDFALSALPPHLRADATVYLLDPAKGYYVGRQGTNGFVCFISRTEWEWGEFRNDIYVPISFDPEGARTIARVYLDVAAMRATGQFTGLQVRDTVLDRLHRGMYVAPARPGISFMLAPIMRLYGGKPGASIVLTMSMPHYMFYAPYLKESDIGAGDEGKPLGPFLSNSGDTLMGAGKAPYGYIIVAANRTTTAKLMADGQGLLARLAAYKPCFKVEMDMSSRE
jgi:hypothetical protein